MLGNRTEATIEQPMSAWISHPAFAPYVRWIDRPELGLPPSLEELSRSIDEAAPRLPDGRRLRLTGATGRKSALVYERSIADDAVIFVRPGSWHDAFNVLAWIAFPRTKAVLNAHHVAEGAAATPNARSRRRDAATLLDESGLILACDLPELVECLRAYRWKALFVERASWVEQHLTAVVIGHGLLDKLRHPYRALTAKTLVLSMPAGTLPAPCELAIWDQHAAQLASAKDFGIDALTPLPVAALPGWDSEHLGATLFDDSSVFRPRSP